MIENAPASTSAATKPRADRGEHEGVHRGHDPRAGQQGAEDREAERQRHQRDVPDLQHPLLLLHDDRVQEGGADEPGHERGVLDRIPPPEAAPADLDVGPVGAEQHPDAEERPGGQRPAPGRHDPALVGLPGQQRGHRVGERHREPDVAEVQHRRVDDHVGVLQRRVQAVAVGRRGRGRERRAGHHQGQGEERRDTAHDRRHPRAGGCGAGTGAPPAPSRPVRIRSHRTSDPAWLPQSAEKR